MTAIPLLVVSLASAGAAPDGVLLDFMSRSCGPCMQMSPLVEKLHREGYPIQQINVDERPDLARRFNVTMIPAFVLVVQGREVNRIVGSTTEGQLKRLLAQIPTASEHHVASSEEEKAPASNEAPRRKSQERIPTKFVNDSTEDKGKGFEFPLLKHFKKKSHEPTVIVERDAPRDAVVRANNDDRREGGPLASTVRIRVRDNGGINFGSGTVIDSRPGRSLILTCGHIFRSVAKGATIEVDVFHGEEYETFAGSVVKFDLEAEVGVVSIATQNRLPVTRIAAVDNLPEKGDRVRSIGCSGGNPPTAEPLVVTDLNKYRGPDNVECTGLPVQGRSGGGLFNRDGEVVGVCFAADPKDDRGLYTGLKPVYQLLAACGLRSDADAPAETNPAGEHAALVAADSHAGRSIREASARTDFDDRGEGIAASSDSADGEEAFASTDEVEESEVVCIIRPLNRPQEASRVVIINRASAKFVRYLQGEMRTQPRQTMARVSNDEIGDFEGFKRASYRSADNGANASPHDRPVQWPIMRVANRPAAERAAEPCDAPHRYRRSAASRAR